ncbi:MAG: hypothetical protein OEU80_05930 [Deltaproteobacteria bacterium]|nr:hypothetical protein [Deltaproteobacteria bacterium]
MDLDLLSSLAVENDTKVVLVVMDGVGVWLDRRGKLRWKPPTPLTWMRWPGLASAGFTIHSPRGSPRAQDQPTSGCSATTRSSI